MAASDLNPCVAYILCALSEAAKGALRTVLGLVRAQLQTTLAAAQAELAKFEMLYMPYIEVASAALQVADQTLDQVQKIVPLEQVNQCADLGGIAQLVAELNDRSLIQEAGEILDDVQRAASIRENLVGAVREIERGIQFVDDLLETLLACD